jgi:Ca2+:H+ antiporter
MVNAAGDWNRMPSWCWAAPLLAAALVGAKLAGLISPANAFVVAAAIVFLGGAVFAAVHHAEVLAVRIGEPFGSILLALSITALEVGLIISVMAAGSADSNAIARDTVYAVVMIVLNGVVGLCLVVGAARHYEQEFHVQGAAAILSVIATLAVIALVLPNFTLATLGPTYSSKQLLFVSAATLCLYVLFVFVQTVRHKGHFISAEIIQHGSIPNARSTFLSAALLMLSLVSVIFLAKILAPVVEGLVLQAGFPIAVVGLVIAAVVLLPEGLAAIKAAKRNHLQTSLNASLGSALASIGLTVPIVGAVSVYLGMPLKLGLAPDAMVLLLLTLFVSTLTFATGRTTILQGAVHLVIFGVFIFLSAVP